MNTGLALVVALLWGIIPVSHKYLLGTFHPYTIMTISGVVYTICLTILVATNRNTIMYDFKNIRSKDIAIITSTAVIAGFFANLLYYRVLKHADKSFVVTSIMYVSPIFTLAFAVFLLKERVTWLNLIGVLLTVSGVCILSIQS